MEEGFCDGQGRRYFPSIVRVGRGKSQAVKNVALDELIERILQTPTDALDQRVNSIRHQLQQIETDAVMFRQQFRDLVQLVKNKANAIENPELVSSEIKTISETSSSTDFEEKGFLIQGNSSVEHNCLSTPPPNTPDDGNLSSGQKVSFSPEVSFSPTSEDDSSFIALPLPPPVTEQSELIESSSSYEPVAPKDALLAPSTAIPLILADNHIISTHTPLETPPPLPVDSPPPLPSETPPPIPETIDNGIILSSPSIAIHSPCYEIRESPIEEDIKQEHNLEPETLENHPSYQPLAQRLNGCLELRSKLLLELQRLDIARMYRRNSGSPSEVRQQLEVSFLDTAHIVFTTLSSAGLPALDASTQYQVLVIDEAAQAVELSTLIPMRFHSKQCVLVGDPQQLPATCFSKGSERSLYERSLFERLESCKHPVHMLKVQYRSHPSISEFPREIFYKGQLEDGENVLSKDYSKSYHYISPALPPLVFFDLLNSRESKFGSAVSRRNVGEAELAVTIYLILKSKCSREDIVGKVGIITPYSQQHEELKRQFSGALGTSYASEVEINTVDGFQGREKDIIILSTVRAEKDSGVGFLNDIRRMNVALTRAKYACYIIGSEDILKTSLPWKSFLDHVWAKNCVVQISTPRIRLEDLQLAENRRQNPSYPSNDRYNSFKVKTSSHQQKNNIPSYSSYSTNMKTNLSYGDISKRQKNNSSLVTSNLPYIPKY